jgi:RNA polymerase sigma factor (sigma-70 family)
MASSTRPPAAEPIGEGSSAPGHAGGNATGGAPPAAAAPPGGSRLGLVGRILRALSRPTPAERRFTELYVEHREIVYRCLASRKDIEGGAVEELLQEVFVEAWKQTEKLTTIANTDAMLVRIMGHTIRNYLKTRKRRPQEPLGAGADVLAAGGRSPEEDAMAIEQITGGELCLSRMDAEAAQLFRWLEIEEKEESAVAKRLGVPLGTVKSRRTSACKEFGVQWRRLQLEARGDRR